MTAEDKARFLVDYPHLRGDVEAIDEALGREPLHDWNAVQERILDLLHDHRAKWKAPEHKLFREVFTQKDPDAQPVPKGGRASSRAVEYEPDADLRDFENIHSRRY